MTSLSTQFGRDDWSRFTFKQRMTRYAIFLGCALAIAWALTSIEVIWPWVWGAPEQIADLFGRMYPPDPSNLETILKVLWDTVNIATFATTFAVLLSLPVAYISAQNTTPNRVTLWLRWRLQHHLFNLGCFIQRHCGKVLFLGLLVLSLCCIGLKTASMETNVEKLWVQGELSMF